MKAQKDMLEELESRLASDMSTLSFSRLADIYRKKGDLKRSIDICLEGINRHPYSVSGRIIVGRCYLEQQKTEEAIKQFLQVVQYDRRNQMAIKMLADIFAAQGLSEKAGDLYAYLLRMDEGNETLAHLSQKYKGKGERNIFKILEIQPIASDLAESTTQTIPVSGQTQQEEWPEKSSPIFQTDDNIASVDRGNVPENRVEDSEYKKDILTTEQDQIALSEISSQASQVLYQEPPASAGHSIEEVLGIAGESSAQLMTQAKDDVLAGSPVSSSDISSRIDQLFGTAEAGTGVPSSSAQPELQQVAPGALQTDEMPQEATQADVPAQAKDDVLAGSPVSSSDISSRIDQLFGTAEAGAGVPSSSAQPELQQVAPGVLQTDEMPQEVETVKLPIVDVSAQDIARRIDDLFGEKPVDLSEEVDIQQKQTIVSAITEDNSKVDEELARASAAPEIMPSAQNKRQIDIIEEKSLFSTQHKSPSEPASRSKVHTYEALQAEMEAKGHKPLSGSLENEFALSASDIGGRLDELFGEQPNKTLEIDLEQQAVQQGAFPLPQQPETEKIAEAGDSIFEGIQIPQSDAETNTAELGAKPQESFQQAPELNDRLLSDISPIEETIANQDAPAEQWIKAETEQMPADATSVEQAFSLQEDGPELFATESDKESVEEQTVDKEIAQSGTDILDDLQKQTFFVTEEKPRYYDDELAKTRLDLSRDQLMADIKAEKTTQDGIMKSETSIIPESEFDVSSETLLMDVEELPIHQVRISPDDVGNRLDEIFSKGADNTSPAPLTERNENITIELEDMAVDERTREFDISPFMPGKKDLYHESLKKQEAVDSTTVNGKDVEQRISEIFNLQQSHHVAAEELVHHIPDGASEEAPPDFYDVSGEMAISQHAETVDVMDTVNFDLSQQFTSGAHDSSVSAAQTAAQSSGSEELEFLLDNTEEEIFVTNSSPDTAVETESEFSSEQDDAAQEDQTQVEETISAKPISIPDHVLTPTLADLYFQQGQAELAINIYTRLLERDPGNEKIASRLEEIKRIHTARLSEQAGGSAVSGSNKSSGSKRGNKKNQLQTKDKPLSGLRISKKYREQYNQTRRKRLKKDQ